MTRPLRGAVVLSLLTLLALLALPGSLRAEDKALDPRCAAS